MWYTLLPIVQTNKQWQKLASAPPVEAGNPKENSRGKLRRSQLASSRIPETRWRRPRKPAGVLSQEVEFRLKAGLRKPTQAERRNQALGHAIGFMAEELEKVTGRIWLDDPFTGRALWHAAEAFVFYCAPPLNNQSADVPPLVVQSAAKMPAELAQRFRTPSGFGHMSAHFIINQIEQAARPPAPHNEWTMPTFFTAQEMVLGSIGRDLRLGAKKEK